MNGLPGVVAADCTTVSMPAASTQRVAIRTACTYWSVLAANTSISVGAPVELPSGISSRYLLPYLKSL